MRVFDFTRFIGEADDFFRLLVAGVNAFIVFEVHISYLFDPFSVCAVPLILRFSL